VTLNPAYLRKYLSAMPGRIPDLVRERMEEEQIDIEEISLAGVHEQIMTTLQKECMCRKTAKSVKKQLGFDGSICDIFVETYHFGCGRSNTRRKIVEHIATAKNVNTNHIGHTNQGTGLRNHKNSLNLIKDLGKHFLRKDKSPVKKFLLYLSQAWPLGKSVSSTR
jgi:hypothetical protein